MTSKIGHYLYFDSDKNTGNSWLYGGNSKEYKINHLQNSDIYGSLPTGPVNNSNTNKIKTSTQYMLPHRPRSVYGMSVMEDLIIIDDSVKNVHRSLIDGDLPIFPNDDRYFVKNDTIYPYIIWKLEI
jgi:hypothetical protein